MHWNSSQLICCDVTMNSFSSPLLPPPFLTCSSDHTQRSGSPINTNTRSSPLSHSSSQATNTVREGKSRAQDTSHTGVLHTTDTALNRENKNRTSCSSLQTCRFKWSIKKGTGLSSRLWFESLLDTVTHRFWSSYTSRVIHAPTEIKTVTKCLALYYTNTNIVNELQN